MQPEEPVPLLEAEFHGALLPIICNRPVNRGPDRRGQQLCLLQNKIAPEGRPVQQDGPLHSGPGIQTILVSPR
ncbi:MAG: hypothetical protein RI897_2622 [Verrucomicrobiota bacterium]|jgi:hypothetical protein